MSGAPYRAVHQRLRRTRGSASEFPCITCGGPARDWAYQHNGGDQEKVTDEGYRYSEDLECYAAMCKKDHLAFDAQQNPSAAEKRFSHPSGGAGPAWGAHHAEKLRTDSEFALRMAQSRTAGGKLGNEAYVSHLRSDPQFFAEQSERLRDAAKVRRKCAQCGLEANGAGVASHQRASGHQGVS